MQTSTFKLLIYKRVTSKYVSQNLVLQNYFGYHSSNEQETQVMSDHFDSEYNWICLGSYFLRKSQINL